MKERAKLAIPIFITMLLGMVLLIVFQASGSQRRDPLFTDLGASPLYAKNGFQKTYTQITQPGEMEWDLIQPPHGGQLIMSDLPAPETSAENSRFSITDREIEEFTILIPFYLDTYKNERIWGGYHSYPAIFIAGIGENWEVYVNGNSVIREIHLDETGRITTYKSSHNVIIPVNRYYLNEGENIVVMHILGARNGNWTGLRYASPYYFGDMLYMMHDYQSYAYLVLCTVFMLSGLFQLLFFAFRKTARKNLLFVGFTFFAAIYFLTKTPIAYSIILNTANIRRLDYASLYFFVPFGVAFIELINPGKLTKPTIVYGIFSVVVATVQWMFPIWLAYELLAIWQIITAVFLIYVILYDLIWQFIKGALKINNDTASTLRLGHAFYRYLVDTEFGNICILMLVLSLTAIFDIVNRAVFNANFTLSQFSQLGVVLCMTYILAKKSVDPLEKVLNEVIGARLTPIETEIVLMTITGEKQYGISRKLQISVTELDQHEENIRKKLNLTENNYNVIDFHIEDTSLPDDFFFNFTERAETLSPVEKRILKLYIDSTNDKEIVSKLFITQQTLKIHNERICTKLGASGTQALMLFIELMKISGQTDKIIT